MIGVALIGVARAGFGEDTPGPLALDGEKATGAAVFDFDGDGDWDLVAPTEDGERLLRNDGSGDWSDMTGERARGLLDSESTRGLLAGDLDHDGFPDLVRVERFRTTVFHNEGPQNHRFEEAWDFEADRFGPGFEGSALLDADNDGWLDVFVAEGGRANWLLVNPGDGSLAFSAVDQAPLGLSVSSNSDFCTVGDWDHDGDIDLVLRGAGFGADAFLREGDRWEAVDGFDLDADDDDKGTVALCDARGTGELDLFWTSEREPSVLAFRWDPTDRGWEGSWNGDGAPDGNHGAICADLDLDGYADLWLSDDDGDDILLGPDLHTETNVDDDSHDTIASTLADFDGDGDLDVYQLHTWDSSVLLWNDADTSEVLQLSLRANTTACPDDREILRDDLGGQARVWDLDGEPLGSRLELSGGTGRGQTAWPVLTFGHVPADERVRVEIDFLYGGLAPLVVEVPAGARRWTVVHDDPDGDGIPTGIEAPLDPSRDLDGDGLLDWADADADGDGDGDRDERGSSGRCDVLVDSDGDGAPDVYDSDSDGVGDVFLDPDDSDGDDVWNAADADPLDAGGVAGTPPDPRFGCGCDENPTGAGWASGGTAGWAVALLLIGRWRARSGAPRRAPGPPSAGSSVG